MKDFHPGIFARLWIFIHRNIKKHHPDMIDAFIAWIAFCLLIAFLDGIDTFRATLEPVSHFVNEHLIEIRQAKEGYRFGNGAAYRISHTTFGLQVLMIAALLFLPRQEVEGNLYTKSNSEVFVAVIAIYAVSIFTGYFGYPARGPGGIFLRDKYAFAFLCSVYTFTTSFSTRLLLSLVTRGWARQQG